MAVSRKLNCLGKQILHWNGIVLFSCSRAGSYFAILSQQGTKEFVPHREGYFKSIRILLLPPR